MPFFPLPIPAPLFSLSFFTFLQGRDDGLGTPRCQARHPVAPRPRRRVLPRCRRPRRIDAFRSGDGKSLVEARDPWSCVGKRGRTEDGCIWRGRGEEGWVRGRDGETCDNDFSSQDVDHNEGHIEERVFVDGRLSEELICVPSSPVRRRRRSNTPRATPTPMKSRGTRPPPQSPTPFPPFRRTANGSSQRTSSWRTLRGSRRAASPAA